MTGPDEASRDVNRPPARRPAAERRTADFGLVVGVDDYPWFRSLRGAVRDARRFHSWLLDENGGNVPEERARLVISNLDPLRPLKVQVDDELERIVEEANALHGGRRLYFHFAGHGIGLRPTDDVALLLAEWTLGKLALSINAYRGNLVGMGLFDEIVILLDCCRSSVNGAVGEPPALTLEPEPRCATKYFIAYATALGSAALEKPTADHTAWDGVFTRRLLHILRGWSGLTALELQSALVCESHGESQQADVVNSICSESSRFGCPGLRHRFEIAFSKARLGKRVTVGRYRNDIYHGEHEHTVDTSLSWRLKLEAGQYKLADEDGNSTLIEHPAQLLDNDEVMTQVVF